MQPFNELSSRGRLQSIWPRSLVLVRPCTCTLSQRRQLRSHVCRAKRSRKSPDDEVDSMDISLSTELRLRADPQYLSKVARHLDVVWNVAKKKKPESCACCEGTGDIGCGYCRGSGALTLGNERFCSLENGCKPCPVCKAKGCVKCQHCMGTGFRAAWMEDPICPASWNE